MASIYHFLDDYFVDGIVHLDENGEFDFEALEAIDLLLFNQHLASNKGRGRDTNLQFSNSQKIFVGS